MSRSLSICSLDTGSSLRSGGWSGASVKRAAIWAGSAENNAPGSPYVLKQDFYCCPMRHLDRPRHIVRTRYKGGRRPGSICGKPSGSSRKQAQGQTRGANSVAAAFFAVNFYQAHKPLLRMLESSYYVQYSSDLKYDSLEEGCTCLNWGWVSSVSPGTSADCLVAFNFRSGPGGGTLSAKAA